MASCKFEGGKYKGKSEVKAHMRHNDISPERREIAKKKNKHIDLTKCVDNFNILGLSYEERCKKYDDRIEYLDTHGNTNKRKDRVTLQCIEIPVPKDLPREKYHEWFFRVADILRKRYGEENFIDGDIHFDEEHTYRDKETKNLIISRVHGHFMIVPEVNGKLNGKEISLRRNMKSLNREIETMTQEEFGCSFMTGEKIKSVKTVEELKQESENAELLFQFDQERQKLDDKKSELDAIETMLSEWQENLDIREEMVSDLEEQKREVLRKQEDIKEKENQLDEALRAASEMPDMDDIIETVLNSAFVNIRLSPDSPETYNFVAMRYVEYLQKQQEQKAEEIRNTANHRAVPEYTYHVEQQQDGMEF